MLHDRTETECQERGGEEEEGETRERQAKNLTSSHHFLSPPPPPPPHLVILWFTIYPPLPTPPTCPTYLPRPPAPPTCPTHLPHLPAGAEAAQGYYSSFLVDPTLSDTSPVAQQGWQLSLWPGQLRGASSW